MPRYSRAVVVAEQSERLDRLRKFLQRPRSLPSAFSRFCVWDVNPSRLCFFPPTAAFSHSQCPFPKRSRHSSSLQKHPPQASAANFSCPPDSPARTCAHDLATSAMRTSIRSGYPSRAAQQHLLVCRKFMHSREHHVVRRQLRHEPLIDRRQNQPRREPHISVDQRQLAPAFPRRAVQFPAWPCPPEECAIRRCSSALNSPARSCRSGNPRLSVAHVLPSNPLT